MGEGKFDFQKPASISHNSKKEDSRNLQTGNSRISGSSFKKRLQLKPVFKENKAKTIENPVDESFAILVSN